MFNKCLSSKQLACAGSDRWDRLAAGQPAGPGPCRTPNPGLCFGVALCWCLVVGAFSPPLFFFFLFGDGMRANVDRFRFQKYNMFTLLVESDRVASLSLSVSDSSLHFFF